MRSVFAGAAVVALAGLAFADVSFTEKSSDDVLDLKKGATSKNPNEWKVTIHGMLVKFSLNDGADPKPVLEKIWDGESKAMTELSPRKLEFVKLPTAYFTKRVEDTKKLLEKEVANLPNRSGESKARAEKLIWHLKRALGTLAEPPKVEVERGEKAKVGEWDCEHVVIREAGPDGTMHAVFDCWMTEQLDGWGAYLEMFAAYRSFSPGVLEKLKELKGFHVKGTYEVLWTVEMLLQTTTFDDSDAKAGDLPAAEFQVPADFKEKGK